MSSNDTLIKIKYTADTEVDAKAFADSIQSSVDSHQFKLHDEEKHVTVDGEQMGSYREATINMLVFTDVVSDVLEHLDNVMFKNEFIHAGSRVIIENSNDEGAVDTLIQQNIFLHDKVQELDALVTAMVEAQTIQTMIANKQVAEINTLAENYRQIKCYLFEVIDLNNLRELVTKVVKEVDPDLLKDFTFYRVH